MSGAGGVKGPVQGPQIPQQSEGRGFLGKLADVGRVLFRGHTAVPTDTQPTHMHSDTSMPTSDYLAWFGWGEGVFWSWYQFGLSFRRYAL